MNEARRIGIIQDFKFNQLSFPFPERAKQILIDYSESGDIDAFIQQGHSLYNLRSEVDRMLSMTDEQRWEYESSNFMLVNPLRFENAFYWGGASNLETLVERLTVFTEWVLEDRSHRALKLSEFNGQDDQSLDKRFSGVLSCLFGELGNFLSNRVWQEVFSWFYGERFDPNRQFPLTFGKEQWRPELLFNASKYGYAKDDFLFNVLSKTNFYFFRDRKDHYLYREDEGGDYDYFARYKLLVGYLLSMFIHLNKACYSLKRYKRHMKDENGNRVNYWAWQSRMRIFIANMNGIFYEDELDDNGKPFASRDPELFESFRKEFSQLNLPEEYYRLEQFVIKHGEDYIYASE